jgi:hypothetical protein
MSRLFKGTYNISSVVRPHPVGRDTSGLYALPPGANEWCPYVSLLRLARQHVLCDVARRKGLEVVAWPRYRV